MSNETVTQRSSRHTYFYVFTDRDVERSQATQEQAAAAVPDRTVREAFGRLAREYGETNATVAINPSDALRFALGIGSLPAFAISAKKLPIDGALRDKPANLPSILNPLKIKERKRIRESAEYVPRVEREIIKQYSTSDDLYQFLRDLHLKNIDHGIVEASRKVENEVRKLGGRKLLKFFVLAKQVVYR